MNDKELKEQLKKEMLDLCETNSSVMTYMECLMRKYENLQSKIDKAIEYCEYNDEGLYTFEPDYDYEENMVDNYEPSNFREDIMGILKDDK